MIYNINGMNMNNFNLKKYKAIFFDLFHTLTYPGLYKYELNEWDLFNISEEFWTHHSINTYSERGIGRIKHPHQIIESILKSADIDYDRKKIEQAAQIRIKKFKNCLKEIKPDILSTIEYLHTTGISLCLISNADALDKMGWPESPLQRYFQYAVFSCDIGIMKPDKEIYEFAINKMQAKPGECLFVGDGGSDEFIGAKLLDMDTLMTTEFIKDLWPERIDKISQDADYMISELYEIIH